MGLGCLGALGFNGFGILCSGFSGLNGFRDLGLHVEASIIRVGATMLGFRVEGSISDVRGFLGNGRNNTGLVRCFKIVDARVCKGSVKA